MWIIHQPEPKLRPNELLELVRHRFAVRGSLPAVDTFSSVKTEESLEGSSGDLEAWTDGELVRYGSTLSKRSARLSFTPKLERRFEADTRLSRLREIRFTMPMAVGFYLLTTITDPVFIPDLGWRAVCLRVAVTPLILLPAIVGRRLSGPGRERLITICAIIAIVALSGIAAASAAPGAVCAFFAPALGLIYANTTVPMRFKGSCFCSLVCCAATVVLVTLRVGADSSLAAALSLQFVIGGSFSVVTSYRIERSSRLNYLLSLREALRLSALSADRAALAVTSKTDALTGIANRGHFDRYGATVVADLARVGMDATILMVDVDHFKQYNDCYGHLAGDECLKRIARTLAHGLPSGNDLAARYGGEEFVILLLGKNRMQAEGIARRLCRSVAALGLEHVARKDDVKVVTVSIGVAAFVIGEAASLNLAIASADRALYVAKRRRNTVESLPHLAA